MVKVRTCNLEYSGSCLTGSTALLLINAPGARQNIDEDPFFDSKFAKEKVCPILYFFVF